MGVPKTVIAGLKMGSLLLISSLSVSIVFAWVGLASFQDLALIWDTVLNIDSFLPLPKCLLSVSPSSGYRAPKPEQMHTPENEQDLCVVKRGPS